MRRFVVHTPSGPRTVLADVVTFEPGHVCFWERRDSGSPLLVVAIHNPSIEWIEEVVENEPK